MEDEVAEGAVDNTEVSTPPIENASESVNPAWNEFLGVLPSSLHPLAIPHLKKWDENFKQQVSQVQSQYEPYKPLLEQGVDYQTVEQALNVVNLLNENPELFFQNMQTFYGFGGGDQGQEQQVPEGEEFDINNPDADSDITQHPKFQELMQNQQMLAQFLVQQQEQEQYQKLSHEIDTELEAVAQKYQGIDQVKVIELAMSSGKTITEAAADLDAYNQKILESARRTPPNVLNPNGGGVPRQDVPDVTKLGGKDTRSLVAQILAAQNGG